MPDFYIFFIDQENETIGSLLSTYLSNDSDVFYCGFLIEHPLNKNIKLKIKLNSNNTFENVINIITNKIDNITNIIEKIRSKFN